MFLGFFLFQLAPNGAGSHAEGRHDGSCLLVSISALNCIEEGVEAELVNEEFA